MFDGVYGGMVHGLEGELIVSVLLLLYLWMHYF